MVKAALPIRLSDTLVQRVQKKWDKEAATTSGLDSLSEISDYVSTQCFALDAAIGHTGIPVGRLTVIQGKEASGKTTIVTQILAECQRRGGIAIYLDCEDAFETDHAAALGLYDQPHVDALGLDVEPLIIVHPEHIIDAFTKIEFLIKAVRELDPTRLCVIAWDSVAATPTTEEAENDTYDSKQPGLAARQVSKGLRRLTGIVAANQVALICVNQVKEKINTGFGGFGDKSATIASAPLGFHATIRMVVAHAGFVGGKRSVSTGITTLVKINKNKIAPPHREAEFDIIYATGIDDEGSMLNMAKTFGIVKVSGPFLKFGEQTFRRSEWPNVECHDEIIKRLKEEYSKKATDEDSVWSADVEAKSLEDEDDE